MNLNLIPQAGRLEFLIAKKAVFLVGLENMKNDKYRSIWKKAESLLLSGKKKDFLLHSKMVERAMREIIVGEGGNSDILIPAAILHDVGWSEVPIELQFAQDKESKHEALVKHIEGAPPIIRRILSELNYDKDRVEKIIGLIVAHKFTDPKEKDKQMLIDADALSDTYKESFYSDVKSYDSTPRKTWEFRSKNTFYTETAGKIFKKQLNDRLKEIKEVDGK